MQSIPARRISERVVGEDADDVGAPADLLVEALERVGRAQLAPVRGSGTRRRPGCRARRLRAASRPWPAGRRGARPLRRADRGPAASESALKIGRISAASRPCWSLRACPRQSLRKWTVQRCQAQPRTLAIAAFSPACASEMASWTPTRPRATRPLRKSVQNASVSASPTSIERISRRPVSCTPCAITSALLTTRPPSRTFSTLASRNRYG